MGCGCGGTAKTKPAAGGAAPSATSAARFSVTRPNKNPLLYRDRAQAERDAAKWGVDVVELTPPMAV